MDDALFDELLASVEEAGAIKRGEATASRRMRYVGRVLLAVEEEGREVWRLSEAAQALSDTSDDLDVKGIREALRQSQEGFAELLGISVGTLRGWEQGRRSPAGAARVLLMVAARHPETVLGTVQQAHKLAA